MDEKIVLQMAPLASIYPGGPTGAATQLAQENPDRPHEAIGGADGRDAEPPATTLKLPDDKIFLTASL
ncbi:MAG: hypothetical protein V2J11_09155 [Desulfofustis sp.]|nr:hypothetical protein [Desulfofustis sp.]